MHQSEGDGERGVGACLILTDFERVCCGVVVFHREGTKYKQVSDFRHYSLVFIGIVGIDLPIRSIFMIKPRSCPTAKRTRATS